MWETISIIFFLGGLEFLLWHLERRRQMKIEQQDDAVQHEQTEVLNGILTELAILNSDDITLETIDQGGGFKK